MRKRLHALLGALTFGIGSIWACNSNVSSGGGGTGGASGQGGVEPDPSSAANGTGAGGVGGQGGVGSGSTTAANGTGAGGMGGQGGVDPGSVSSSSAGGGGAVCVSSSDFTKCKESSGGQCFCEGTCDGNPVHVYCHWMNTTQFCSCYAGSTLIGECQGADPCLVEKTCCADLF